MLVARSEVEDALLDAGAGLVFCLLHGVQNVASDLVVLDSGEQLSHAVGEALNEHVFVALDFRKTDDDGVSGAQQQAWVGWNRAGLYGPGEELVEGVVVL